jgi:hypothetical protein
MPVENWKTPFKVFLTVRIVFQYQKTNKLPAYISGRAVAQSVCSRRTRPVTAVTTFASRQVHVCFVEDELPPGLVCHQILRFVHVGVIPS